MRPAVINALYSLLVWTVGGLYFILGASALAVVWAFVDSRRTDALTRLFCRGLVRLAGAGVEVVVKRGFDGRRPGFLCPNHVNVLDPFVLYPASPLFVRALELESHFDIPFYGWMMRRFGMIPVPDAKTTSQVRRLWASVEGALRAGTSLIVFPEGGRTLDGKLRPFKDGVFRMARKFGAPITPVTIAGAYAWNRKGSWRFHPGRVIVTIHDTVQTEGRDEAEVREQVRAAIQSGLDAKETQTCRS